MATVDRTQAKNRLSRASGNFAVPRPAEALPFTGERLTTAISGQIEFEHYHRYCIARDHCAGLDVLDIASGEGYGTAILAGVASSVVGVEIDHEVVSHAQAAYPLANCRFEQGDAQAIPLDDASVDVVVSFETLEHLGDHDAFFTEVRRVLRSGGMFIVSTPNRDVYSARGSSPNPFHILELTEGEFRTLLKEHFNHFTIALQRPFLGSLVVWDTMDGWRTFERRSADVIEATMGLARPHYLIAIASDASIPASHASAYIDRRSVQGALEHRGYHPTLDQAHHEREVAHVERQMGAGRIGAYNRAIGAIMRSAVFDEDWYAAQAGHVGTGRKALVRHYVAVGEAQGLTPHPLFDAAHYRATYLAGASPELNALDHYLNFGAKARHPPHPLFDPEIYRRSSKDMVGAEEPVGHYMAIGRHERWQTHLLFDPEYYALRNADALEAGADPLLHFLSVGHTEARSPHPLFDLPFYLDRNRDVADAGGNGLVHYVCCGWREGRTPHPLFDLPLYLRQNPDVAQAGTDPLAHFIAIGFSEARSPHPLFDSAFYLGQTPSVATDVASRAGGNALIHFVTEGYRDGLSPHPLFDPAAYLDQNPDAAEAGANALIHYVVHGS